MGTEESHPTGRQRGVPDAVVARLPLYLRVLAEVMPNTVMSSEQLAELAGVNAAKVRKDLSFVGTYGMRGVGYDVDQLRHELASILGLSADVPVVLAGLGNLGQALAGYGGFTSRGFHIVGLFDEDPHKINTRIGGVTVHHPRDIHQVCKEHHATMAVLSVPAKVAQSVVDVLVAAGVTSILNFAPVVLNVPRGVMVRQVDLASELQILNFHHQQHIPN